MLFDVGGVVLDSPLKAIADYEQANRIPIGAINRLVAERGDSGAWARHERGEVDFSGFCDGLEAEASAVGFVLDPAELMARIAASVAVRHPVIEEIRRLRRSGIKTAAVTNNWQGLRHEELADEFDVMVESCREGVRKPDPEIYRRALERLSVHPAATLVLDDIGANLKTARAMGMETFKVDNLDDLLNRLRSITSSAGP
ncbi:MAG: HAD family hydrolase [Actinomycetota bacterium]